MFVFVNGSRLVSAIAHDVVDSASKGFDWVVDVTSAFLMHALAFDSILLVWYADGSVGCSKECGQCGCVWDMSACVVTKGDRFDVKRLSVGLGVTRTSVFTNSE